MTNILDKRHARTLAAFASADLLVAFDFDGTLSSVVLDPKRAGMRDRTRRLLYAVARRYPVAILSGRARVDLKKAIGRVPVRHLVGNHGIEPWGTRTRYLALVRRWVRRLEQALPPMRGLTVEDKRYSLTIHYRAVRNRRRAHAAIIEAVSSLRGARVIGGKCAVSLVPRGASDKGDALRHARRLLGCGASLYVGDDETDEDAFRAEPRRRLLAIRVGRRPGSAARHYLTSQIAIDRLLETLVALRPTPAAASPRRAARRRRRTRRLSR